MNFLLIIRQRQLPSCLWPIDYPAALALRQMAAFVENLPKYLLAPEISALLHFMPDLRRKMLFTTLWNTGARISEALDLTKGDFLSSTRSYSWPRSSSARKRPNTAPDAGQPALCRTGWCRCQRRNS